MDNTPAARRPVSRRRLLTGAAGAAAAGAFAGALAAPLPASAGPRRPRPAHRRPQRERRPAAVLPVRHRRHRVGPGGQRPAARRLPHQRQALPGAVPAARRGADFRHLPHAGQHHRPDRRQGDHRRHAGRRPPAGTATRCHSNTGPRNWETFHIAQLLPWIDANFRTFAEYNGRAVAGFSMGGFGALKYTAKYYGHFCSVSSHSGPASLRRDFGLVVHWANATSAALDLGGGTVYGVAAVGRGAGHRRQPGPAHPELPQQADLPGGRHLARPDQLVRHRQRDPGAGRSARVPGGPRPGRHPARVARGARRPLLPARHLRPGPQRDARRLRRAG